jgi:electron transfer flavoprotein alpha/beta subunit
MKSDSVHQTFTAALDALVEQIKEDRSVLAVVLCGSLSHDAATSALPPIYKAHKWVVTRGDLDWK